MMPNGQHAHMRIACPHCQAIYEVASTDPDVSFICSRCRHEFRIGDSLDAEPAADSSPPVPDEQMGLFETQHPATNKKNKQESAGAAHEYPAETSAQPPLFLERLATTDTLTPAAFAGEKAKKPLAPPARKPLSQESPVPDNTAPKTDAAAISKDDEVQEPTRRAPRILNWLSVVMMLVAVAGFAYNHASWSGNVWLRSILLNLHMPITVHATDWRIPPKSVHAEWLKRDNGSAVLVIEGRVDNLLHTELATPWIEVTVYDAFHSDKTIKRKTLPITLPPAIDAIRHAPWTPPPQDNVPVAAAGSRGFILVMDNLPKHAGEFTLDVVPSLFR
jgi:hypothetical protein